MIMLELFVFNPFAWVLYFWVVVGIWGLVTN